MVKKKVEFNVGGATILVVVENAKELKEEIKDIRAITQMVTHDLKDIIPESVVVRADLTQVFSSDGNYLVFISKGDLQRNEQVILAVYGYGAKGATLEQLEKQLAYRMSVKM